MRTIRVIAGRYRGKTIPFSTERFNADITPQKVKGALFSILGEELNGRSFLDLFAGSGQIGIEAMSRGAAPVIFVEKDPRRSRFINEFISLLGEKDRCRLFKASADRALKKIAGEDLIVDTVFLDPPYDKKAGMGDRYSALLEVVSNSGILHNSSICIVQHFSKNILVERIASLLKTDIKVYGSTSLSIYKYA